VQSNMSIDNFNINASIFTHFLLCFESKITQNA